MRIQRLSTVFFLSIFLAAPAAAFEIKPGEWEMELDGVNVPKEVKKTKICITPDQAKSHYMPREMKGCKLNSSGEKAGVISYEMICDMQGMKMETKGTLRKIGSNEIVMDATTTTTPSGQKEQAMKMETKASTKKISENEIVMDQKTVIAGLGTQQITTRQKYLGPNCSKDAMPMPGSAPGK